MTSAISPFELDQALPSGRLAIEASAGTGKTHTLSTLAARFVAEQGVPIAELLVVTFTRAAAAELKDRVRSRLVEFAEALTNADSPPNDPLLKVVWSTDRENRLQRVQSAITEFDAATITTIHGFAQQVIGTLGSTVLTDPDAVLIDDSAALTRQVATDLLVAEAVSEEHSAEEIPSLELLRRAVSLALNNPDARLVPDIDLPLLAPDPPTPDGNAESEQSVTDAYNDALSRFKADCSAVRLRVLVDATVTAVAHRRRTAGTLSFDDLLLRLRDALIESESGAAACHSLQERFRVALIDEFQDTDPVQWTIFDSVFGRSDVGASTDPDTRPTTLVLVGDPKQAIYGFRGANLHTYLQATHAPDTELTGLGTNWRSDPASLQATATLLDGVTFGDADILFQPVEAPSQHANHSFADHEGTLIPALSIRLMMGPNIVGDNPRGVVPANRGEPAIFRELAAHIRHLLETATIPDDDRGAVTISEKNDQPHPRRPLRPDDVAVLIAANRQGSEIRDALLRLGIPAVISRGDNVLGSEASTHWHRLLHAVARPADSRRVRAAALTWFFGWNGNRLADTTDEELSTIQEQLLQWGDHLSHRGVASFVGRIWSETAVTSRVLGLPDGDRSMTDLDHIAELLSAAGGTDVGPTTLLTMFEQLAGGNDDGDPEADLAARRVESESRAVQIMTTFVAKGLEFPVVCCPTLWNPQGAKASDNIWWDHDEKVRTIDVASKADWGPPEARSERQRQAAMEAVGTNLRVLYVALTRARHHTAVWWLPTDKVWKTGLARVLFARSDDGEIDPEQFDILELAHLDDVAMMDRLRPVIDKGNGVLEALVVDDPTTDYRRWTGAGHHDPVDLQVATLDRPLDRSLSRWSFTAITARAHDVTYVGFDPFDDSLGDAGSADEIAAPQMGLLAPDPTDSGSAAGLLPLGDIAGGAGFGTLVHEILEQVDFTVTNLDEELAGWVDDRLAWNPWPVDRDALVAGLAAVIRTPMGPLFANQALADLTPANRLDELDFDLTLGESGLRCTDADIGHLVLDHLASDDPHRPWAAKLADGPFDTVLAGHLTGSIDLVARVAHLDGSTKFVVSDYKTNRLAPRGVQPTSAHFHPHRLPEAMAEHHYQLQALLYSVALHRYLRWRLPTYDPATHLGGVGYLFVRGMVGPDTPTVDGVPHGVCDWRPPCALIIDLSDLLDGALSTQGGSP